MPEKANFKKYYGRLARAFLVDNGFSPSQARSIMSLKDIVSSSHQEIDQDLKDEMLERIQNEKGSVLTPENISYIQNGGEILVLAPDNYNFVTVLDSESLDNIQDEYGDFFTYTEGMEDAAVTGEKFEFRWWYKASPELASIIDRLYQEYGLEHVEY